MLNNVSLVGRLTKEPETRRLEKGTVVCNFTLAVNRAFKDENGEKQADFIQCQAWQKQAEFIEKFVSKGQLVAVTGEIHTRTYEREDKTTAYVTEINCNSIQSLEKRSEPTEEDIRMRWNDEWTKRSDGLDAKAKAILKKELNEKYQPRIDELKAKQADPSKNDLPY